MKLTVSHDVPGGCAAAAMYLDHFGFDSEPFNITPDSRFLFASTRHREAMAALHYGIEQRKGFIALTGEIGSGKTTICRALLKELDRERIRLALILNPQMSDLELLQAINAEFGVEHHSDSKRELLDALNRFLLDEYAKEHNCVLVIDESQRLSPDALEQVRLISNLELESTKLIQIALVGQPELDDLLHLPELEQLNQRIMVRYHIDPLDHEETRQYLEHRLHVANPETPAKFNGRAVKAIYDYSGGVPRKINVVADRALLVAFVQDKFEINGTMAQKAIEEVAGRRPNQKRESPKPKRLEEPTPQAAAAPIPAVTKESTTPAVAEKQKGGSGILALAIIIGCLIIGTAYVLSNGGLQALGLADEQTAQKDNPSRNQQGTTGQQGVGVEEFFEDLTDIGPTPTPAPSPAPENEAPADSVDVQPDTELALVVPAPDEVIEEGVSSDDLAVEGSVADELTDTGETPAPTPRPAQPEPTPPPSPTPLATPSPTPLPTPTPVPDPGPVETVSPDAEDEPLPEWSYDKQKLMRVEHPQFTYAASVLTWISLTRDQKLPEEELERLRSMDAEEISAYKLTTGAAPLFLRQATLPPIMGVLQENLLPALAQVDRRAEGFGPWSLVTKYEDGEVHLADPLRGRITVEEDEFEESLASLVVPYTDPDQLTGLAPGHKGKRVDALQIRLIKAGVYQGDPSGMFDRETEEAVRQFRERNNLPGEAKVDELLALALTKSKED